MNNLFRNIYFPAGTGLYGFMVFIICINFISCNHNHKPGNSYRISEKDFNSKIKGDWFVRIHSRNTLNFNNMFSLSFADSSICNRMFRNAFAWKGDSIMISFYDRRDGAYTRWEGFNLNYITDSTLSLGSHSKIFGGDSNYYNIKFRKLLKCPSNENVLLEKLFIERTGCYGWCPVFSFEINHDGKFYYKGESFVDSIGSFSGIVDSAILNLLKEKIQYIDFQQIKDFYSSDWTCDELIHLTFVLRDKRNKELKTIKTNVYGNQEVTFEIENLINYLTYIPNCLTLTRTKNRHL